MLKKFIFLAVFLGIAAPAMAGSLTLSVASGEWQNPQAPGGVCIDVDNVNGTGLDGIRWGGGDLNHHAPTPPGNIPELAGYSAGGDACFYGGSWASVSGYNFDPFDGSYTFPGASSPFSLGSFEHLNFPITDGITQVDYRLNLSTSGGSTPIEMTFLHNETDNDCHSGPNCSDDTVQVILPFVSKLLTVGSDQYLLQLLGFSPDGIGAFATSFQSPENGKTTTQLWATITPLTPVPEPASMVLLGSGLLGLGAAARRRLRKNKAQTA